MSIYIKKDKLRLLLRIFCQSLCYSIIYSVITHIAQRNNQERFYVSAFALQEAKRKWKNTQLFIIAPTSEFYNFQ